MIVVVNWQSRKVSLRWANRVSKLVLELKAWKNVLALQVPRPTMLAHLLVLGYLHRPMSQRRKRLHRQVAPKYHRALSAQISGLGFLTLLRSTFRTPAKQIQLRLSKTWTTRRSVFSVTFWICGRIKSSSCLLSWQLQIQQTVCSERSITGETCRGCLTVYQLSWSKRMLKWLYRFLPRIRSSTRSLRQCFQKTWNTLQIKSSE